MLVQLGISVVVAVILALVVFGRVGFRLTRAIFTESVTHPRENSIIEVEEGGRKVKSIRRVG